MQMNQKTAFKILGLEPGASLAQAKKAFRDLAKQYHPDRCVSYGSFVDGSGSEPQAARLNRMKEINQAFHLLVPLLTPIDGLTGKTSTGKAPPSMKEAARKNTGLWFSDILKRLKKGLNGHKKPVSPSRTSIVKQPQASPSQQKNRPGKTDRFATVLKTLHPGVPAGNQAAGFGRDVRGRSQAPGAHPRASRTQPYDRFIKYMALKRQIDAGTRRKEGQNHSRIERIRPVPRVNPIGSRHDF